MNPNEEGAGFKCVFVRGTSTASELPLDSGTSSGISLADLTKNRLIIYQFVPSSNSEESKDQTRGSANLRRNDNARI